MSYVIASIDLSAATTGTTGTVDWSIIGQQATIGRYDSTARAVLTFLNESGCGLKITFNNGQQFYLPAGGWQPVSVAADCTSASYSVVYTLSNPLVTQLLVTWYAPDEPVPPAPILGNSPIGGSITANTASVLQGNGQINGQVTTVGGNTDGGPTILPVVASKTIRLSATDANALRLGGLTVDINGNLQLLGKPVLLIAGQNEALSGVGMPAIVRSVDNQSVTTTGNNVLISYTTPNDGNKHSYRATGWATVANGVSGNNINFGVTYTRPNGASRSTAFPMWTATALAVMSGAISIANALYEGLPLYFTANPNTSITVNYNDPTNTPGDSVSALLERLT